MRSRLHRGCFPSATTYEGRTFSVTSWTDTVPQMIVKGSLTPWRETPVRGDDECVGRWGATSMLASLASLSAAPTADALPHPSPPIR